MLMVFYSKRVFQADRDFLINHPLIELPRTAHHREFYPEGMEGLFFGSRRRLFRRWMDITLVYI